MQETSEILNSQAIDLAAKGNFKEAIACLNRALVIDKENYLLWYNMGITYRDAGNLLYSKKALLQSYKLNNEDEELLETLASVCFSLNNVDEAFAYCKEGIDLNPENPHFWNNLGVFLFSEEKYNDASVAFETAVSINPRFYDALFNLRDTYIELGNKVGAEECSKHLQDLKFQE